MILRLALPIPVADLRWALVGHLLRLWVRHQVSKVWRQKQKMQWKKFLRSFLNSSLKRETKININRGATIFPTDPWEKKVLPNQLYPLIIRLISTKRPRILSTQKKSVLVITRVVEEVIHQVAVSNRATPVSSDNY